MARLLLALILPAALILAAPEKREPTPHFLSRRQSISPQCQSQCAAFEQDVSACDQSRLALCFCPSQAEDDLLACWTCDNSILPGFTQQNVTQILDLYCAPQGEANPNSLSGSSYPPSCCSALMADFNSCSMADLDLSPCVCSDQQQQDFLQCAQCSPLLVDAWGGDSNVTAAVASVNLYCDFLSNTVAGTPSTTSDTASSTGSGTSEEPSSTTAVSSSSAGAPSPSSGSNNAMRQSGVDAFAILFAVGLGATLM